MVLAMISPRPWPLVIASLLGPALPGCVIPDIDWSRPCPCVDGWVCDESSGLCVRPGDAGEMPLDAGEVPVDAGDVPSDAGEMPWDARVDAGDVPIDAGAPPPPTCETVRDAIFCEDFESGDLRKWSSVMPAEGGMIAPSPSAARAGASGLRMTTPASTTASRLSASIDSGAATALYFRAWVRVPSASVGPIDLFELEVAGAGTISAQMVPARGSFVVHVAPTGGTELSDSGRDGRWTVGAWTCVAGRVVRGEGTGSVEIFDAGPQAAALSGLDTEWGAPFTLFSIAVTPSTAGSEVQLDDVMWTTTQVSCP